MNLGVSCRCGTLACSGKSCNPVAYQLAELKARDAKIRLELENIIIKARDSVYNWNDMTNDIKAVIKQL